MEWINSLVTTVAAIILYFMLKNAIPSYFTKKGSNLADKEDIREITERVESVKKEFSDKTEQLRSELQFSNQIAISVKSEERNAIINCYEKYRAWIHYISHMSPILPTDEGLSELKKQQDAIEIAYNEYLFAESKMIFFVGKDWYTKYLYDLKVKAIELSSDATSVLIEILEVATIHLINMKEEPADKRSKLITDDSSKIRKLVLGYRQELYKQYPGLVGMEDVWRDECLKRVSRLYN